MTNAGYLKITDDIIEHIKLIDPSYLLNYGVVQVAKKAINGKTSYVCPECGNGTGRDGTGIVPSDKKGVWTWHCFKCDAAFDNIKLLADHYGLNERSDFIEICQRACRDFHISAEWIEAGSKNFSPAPKKNPPPPPVDNTPADKFKKYIKNLQPYLPKFIENCGGYWRGLSLKTLQHFQCAFNPNYSKFGLPFMIIPSSWKHYLARFVGNLDDYPAEAQDWIESNGKGKKHSQSPKSVFNLKLARESDEPIFLVEGEIDAMSGWQATDGLPFVAICGSAITSKMLAEFQSLPPGKKFIVLLDNDDTGKEKAPTVAETLINIRHFAIVAHFDENYNDLNDFLQANPAALRENLFKIYDDAKAKFEKLKDEGLSAIIPPADSNEVNDSDGVDIPDYRPRLTSKQIFPNCPIDLEIPAGFAIDPFGIYGSKGSIIALTPLVVTRLIQSANHAETTLELAVFDRKNNSWHKHSIDQKSIADNRKILQLADYGVAITQAQARYLSQFLMDMCYFGKNISIIPQTINYFQPGWTDKNCEKFIYPVCDDDSYVVNCNSYNFRETFAAKGDKVAWLEQLHRIVFSSTVARITLGAALAAPLIRLLNSRNIHVHLSCPSGSGKSAILKFALSIFGDPDFMIRTFNGTENSWEGIAVAHNDLPHGLDELQAAKKSAREEMDTAVYRWEGGLTRSRLTREGKQRPVYSFRGARISTAEQPLTTDHSGQGAKRRVLEITNSNILPQHLAVDLHSFVKNNFGLFGRDWINFIISRKSDFVSCFSAFNSNMIAKFPDILPDHINSISISLFALANFLLMLVEKNFDFLHPALDFVESNKLNDFQTIVADLPNEKQTTNVERALEALAELPLTHAKFFKVEKFSSDDDGTKLAMSDDGLAQEIYGIIFKDGTIGFFKRQLKKILDNEGFPSSDAIIKSFADAGFLLPATNPKYPYQRAIRFSDGKIYRLIIFKAGTFEIE